MNYFNSLLNQAKDLFLSLTPQAKVMAILMAGVIVVSGGFLVQGTSTTAKEKLFGGYVFTDLELKNAQIALSVAKLSDWEIQGNQLLVPKAQRDLYLKALGEGGAFPKDLGSWTEKALDSGTIFDGNLKNHARMMAAKQKDISQAISQLPAVEYAWVNYDEQREGFAREVKKTASVFVMPSNHAPISDQLKRDISRMIQASFAGLRYEDVSFMDLFNGSTLVGSEDPMTSEYSKFIAIKRQYEQDLKKKALNLLADYGDVRVEVTAELDDTARKATEEVKLDKPTSIQTQSTTKSVESSKAGNGGRPGVEPNVGPNRGASLAESGGSSSKTKEVTESDKKMTGRQVTYMESPGHTLKNASFSVVIPKSYLLKLHQRQWQDLNPSAKPTDKAPDLTEATMTELQNSVSRRIEDQLVVLLPPSPALEKGANKFERVKVGYELDQSMPELAKASMAETGMAWLANSWQTLAMLGVAIFAILVLRSAVVSQPKSKDEEFARGFGVQVDEALVGGDLSALMREEEGDSGEEGDDPVNENAPSHRFTITGEKVREELSQIVRENPSAAVNIIRNWIGDAA